MSSARAPAKPISTTEFIFSATYPVLGNFGDFGLLEATTELEGLSAEAETDVADGVGAGVEEAEADGEAVGVVAVHAGTVTVLASSVTAALRVSIRPST